MKWTAKQCGQLIDVGCGLSKSSLKKSASMTASLKPTNTEVLIIYKQTKNSLFLLSRAAVGEH